MEAFKQTASLPTHYPITYVPERHKTTIHQMKACHKIIHPVVLQVMDIQINSKLLDKILEDYMMSVSRGQFDVNLLGPDLGLDLEEDLDTTNPCSIVDELKDGSPTHHT